MKFLLGHSLFSSGLHFLFSVFGISVDVEVRHDLSWVLMGDDAMPVLIFMGQHPQPQTQWNEPFVLHGMAMSTQHRGETVLHRVTVALGS